jgi:6-phosphogluconolactonase
MRLIDRCRLHVLLTPEALAETGAERFVEVVRQAVAERGRATVALAGGSTPMALYRRLTATALAAQMPWHRLHLFWSDERCVPREHAQNNAGNTLRQLRRAPLPQRAVHRIAAELPDPEQAARAYESELRTFFGDGGPRVDLALLGIGEDGHTASLFADSAALETSERWVTTDRGPQRTPPRITWTVAALSHARHAIFLASGMAKARAVAEVLTTDESQAPAALVARAILHAGGTVEWLLDSDAAVRVSAASGG